MPNKKFLTQHKIPRQGLEWQKKYLTLVSWCGWLNCQLTLPPVALPRSNVCKNEYTTEEMQSKNTFQRGLTNECWLIINVFSCQRSTFLNYWPPFTLTFRCRWFYAWFDIATNFNKQLETTQGYDAQSMINA